MGTGDISWEAKSQRKAEWVYLRIEALVSISPPTHLLGGLLNGGYFARMNTRIWNPFQVRGPSLLFILLLPFSTTDFSLFLYTIIDCACYVSTASNSY